MSKDKTTDRWEKKISSELVGKTIAKIEYLSPKEGEEMMWYKLPLAITFTDGSWIFPMADDEGNDGGSLATSIEGLETIPVMGRD
jgi:hypothetical protein